MGGTTRESISKIKRRVLECIIGRIIEYIEGFGEMVNSMGKESMYCKTVIYAKASGTTADE